MDIKKMSKEEVEKLSYLDIAYNLLKHEHKTLTKSNEIKNDKKIFYEYCMNVISKLRFNNDSDLFALERNQGLKGIIGNI